MAMLSIKYFNFKFLQFKIYIKNKFIEQIVNNTLLAQNLICIKKINNMQSNNQIFRICSYANFLSGSCKQQLRSSLYLNFILKNKRLNSVRMWCKTHDLPLQFQHVKLSYCIFKNKHNCTKSILIPIYKSNQIVCLFRCYQV